MTNDEKLASVDFTFVKKHEAPGEDVIIMPKPGEISILRSGMTPEQIHSYVWKIAAQRGWTDSERDRFERAIHSLPYVMDDFKIVTQDESSRSDLGNGQLEQHHGTD